jgi:hypothetical protein
LFFFVGFFFFLFFVLFFVFTRNPIIFHNPYFCQILRRSPHFRNWFCNLVHVSYFQFATLVNKVDDAMPYAAKRQLIHLSYVHYRLPKEGSTIVCKLFSQIRVELILKWQPSDGNPYQGRCQARQRKEL